MIWKYGIFLGLEAQAKGGILVQLPVSVMSFLGTKTEEENKTNKKNKSIIKKRDTKKMPKRKEKNISTHFSIKIVFPVPLLTFLYDVFYRIMIR